MSKTDIVLRLLKSGTALGSREAMRHHNIYRLAGCIHVLRRRGHDIKTTLYPTDNGRSRFAVYSL